MPGLKLVGLVIASLSLVGLEGAAFSQAKITTTGRVYKPTPPVEQKAEPSPEPQQVTPEDDDMEDYPDEEAGPEPQTDTDRLNLVCRGGGSANKASVGTVNAWNSYGGWAGATVVGQRSQGFADQVRVRLDDDDPRLRMPRSMLPAIRGGKDGWFKLKDVQYGEGEITASVAVSMFNNPKLRLDRYTGAISISGKSGDFTGECRKFNPKKVKKAF